MPTSSPSKVITGTGKGQVDILGSSFVAVCLPLDDVSSFKDIYASFKKEHPKAAHVPYAYIVNEYSKCFDDGEPSGAAGRAMLEMLKNQGIVKGALMVARYFGGTKLGLPRLRKAFVSSSKEALLDSTVGLLKTLNHHRVTLSYSDYEAFKRIAPKYSLLIKNEEFNDNVILSCLNDGRIIEVFEKNNLKPISLEDLGNETIITEDK